MRPLDPIDRPWRCAGQSRSLSTVKWSEVKAHWRISPPPLSAGCTKRRLFSGSISQSIQSLGTFSMSSLFQRLNTRFSLSPHHVFPWVFTTLLLESSMTTFFSTLHHVFSSHANILSQSPVLIDFSSQILMTNHGGTQNSSTSLGPRCCGVRNFDVPFDWGKLADRPVALHSAIKVFWLTALCYATNQSIYWWSCMVRCVGGVFNFDFFRFWKCAPTPMILFSKFMVWGLVQLELFWELSDFHGCDCSRWVRHSFFT